MLVSFGHMHSTQMRKLDSCAAFRLPAPLLDEPLPQASLLALDDACANASRPSGCWASARMRSPQVAQMLGYFDPANFTREFRQWTGLTPSAWREAYRPVQR